MDTTRSTKYEWPFDIQTFERGNENNASNVFNLFF